MKNKNSNKIPGSVAEMKDPKQNDSNKVNFLLIINY